MTWPRALLLAAVGAVLGALLGWDLHRSPVREVVKWKTEVKTKYVTVEHIRTLPGSTVYLNSDGSTVITGPVELTRSSAGQSEQTTTGQHDTIPVERSWLVGAGAGTGISGGMQYGIMGGRRVGPFWVIAQVYVPEPRAYLGVALLW